MNIQFKADRNSDIEEVPLVGRLVIRTALGHWEAVESKDGALLVRLIEGPNSTIAVEPLASNHIKVRPT